MTKCKHSHTQKRCSNIILFEVLIIALSKICIVVELRFSEENMWIIFVYFQEETQVSRRKDNLNSIKRQFVRTTRLNKLSRVSFEMCSLLTEILEMKISIL